MSIELTPDMIAAVSEPVSDQFYLIELHFQTGLTRWSTSGERTWDSKFWARGATLPHFTNDTQLLMTNTITLPMGDDKSVLAMYLSSSPRDCLVKIWRAAGQAQPQLFFVGAIDDSEIVGASIKLSIASASDWMMLTPRLRVYPPLCNHLPKPGTELNLSDGKWILE